MGNQLERITKSTFKIEADVTPISMVFPSSITIEQLKGIGRTFVSMDSSKQWWIGDWWVRLEKDGNGQDICNEV